MYADMERPREVTEEQRKMKKRELFQGKVALRPLIVLHFIGYLFLFIPVYNLLLYMYVHLSGWKKCAEILRNWMEDSMIWF